MLDYYLVTNTFVKSLGNFISNTEAEDSAMEKFNLSPESNAWLVLSVQELRKIVADADQYIKKASN